MARWMQVMCAVLVGGLALTSMGALATDVEEFDEFEVFVEINATDATPINMQTLKIISSWFPLLQGSAAD